jgi:hypothetical protein
MVLQEGMVFSVEPGIYLSGRFGMRVEDIVLIDEGKAEILNTSRKDMVVLWGAISNSGRNRVFFTGDPLATERPQPRHCQ